MKVLHVFMRFPHRYQGYNIALIERLNAAGVESFVFSFYHGHSVGNRLRKLKFILLGMAKLSLVARYRRSAGMTWLGATIFVGRMKPIFAIKPNVIHVHNIRILTTEFRIFLRMVSIPCVVSLRGSDALIEPLQDESSRACFGSALNFVDSIHAVSSHIAQVAGKYVGHTDKISVIRRTPTGIVRSGTCMPLNRHQVVLTSIGRLNWVKGFTYLLQALKLLKERGFNIRLNLVGDGELSDKLQILYWANLLEVESIVTLHGYLKQDEIANILAKTSIYVQPSISEGIPNTLIQAIANRIPIVASDVGGIPEIVSRDHGILTPPGDYEAIADAIERIITDNAFRSQLFRGDSAITMNPEREMQEYLALYVKTVERSNLAKADK